MHLCRNLHNAHGRQSAVHPTAFPSRKLEYNNDGRFLWNRNGRFRFRVRALGSRYVGVRRVTRGGESELVFFGIFYTSDLIVYLWFVCRILFGHFVNIILIRHR